MTKQEELTILRDAINRIGQDSYSGEWLESVYVGIEDAIRSDMPVNVRVPSLAEAKRVHTNMIDDGRVKRDQMVAEALETAKRIKDEAIKEVEEMRDKLARDISRAARAVQEW
jgi:hypothetical protein